MTVGHGQTIDEPTSPNLGHVLEFMRVIWELDHALQRRSKRMESELGVTGPQRLVLLIVGRFPGIPAGHLAQVLHVHPSTLTGVLQRLVRQGLIRRRADPGDGRRSLFSLTDEGRHLNTDAPGTVEAAIGRVLSRVARNKIEAARDVISSIAAALREPADSRAEPERT